MNESKSDGWTKTKVSPIVDSVAMFTCHSERVAKSWSMVPSIVGWSMIGRSCYDSRLSYASRIKVYFATKNMGWNYALFKAYSTIRTTSHLASFQKDEEISFTINRYDYDYYCSYNMIIHCIDKPLLFDNYRSYQSIHIQFVHHYKPSW